MTGEVPTRTEEERLGSEVAYPAGLACSPDGSLFASPEVAGFGGLTKRELFAAMLMQGIYANPDSTGSSPEYCAEDAIKAADALLKELAK